jgi:hypothetical protein
LVRELWPIVFDLAPPDRSISEVAKTFNVRPATIHRRPNKLQLLKLEQAFYQGADTKLSANSQSALRPPLSARSVPGPASSLTAAEGRNRILPPAQAIRENAGSK